MWPAEPAQNDHDDDTQLEEGEACTSPDPGFQTEIKCLVVELTGAVRRQVIINSFSMSSRIMHQESG
jgi:hypothetical protein